MLSINESKLVKEIRKQSERLDSLNEALVEHKTLNLELGREDTFEQLLEIREDTVKKLYEKLKELGTKPIITRQGERIEITYETF